MSVLLEMAGVHKDYQALRPLRIANLAVRAGDMLSIGGIDAVGAETFVNLVTGATLPDQGDVTLFGQNTRAITDSAAWLSSLDGVGMITARGIVVEGFSVLQNIALSLTLDVDPIDPRFIPQAGALARDAGIDASMFDLPAGGVTATIIRCPVPGADEAWTVGLVTGPSGCGKSTLARRAFPGAVWCGGEPWPSGRAVVDGFPPGLGVGEVVELLGGVGLNSPPAWLRPYAALSVGQQWRADLARGLAVARQRGVVACADEFTSVVDRDTARAGSAAAARLARRLGVRLVAVGCHDDILEWLDPDWVARPAEGACARRALQGRPKVRLDVFRCRVQAWDLFREHHYLSHSIDRKSTRLNSSH